MKDKLKFVEVKKKIQSSGFFDDACYQFYLIRLLNCLNVFKVKLHSYVLLEGEILLLCSPLSSSALRSLLAFLNKSYSEYFNIRFHREIAVWNERPSITNVEESLAMACQKLIEGAPLRQGLVRHPGEYEWSSYCSNSLNRFPLFLTPHSVFKSAFAAAPRPFYEYRRFIETPFSMADLNTLQQSLKLRKQK